MFCFCKKKKADDEKEKAEQAGKEEEGQGGGLWIHLRMCSSREATDVLLSVSF